MSIPSNIVRGKLVLQSLPDGFCFTDAKDFISQLPALLGVEIPGEVTNVVVSNVQPNSSQTTSVWVRIGNSGGFVGLYVFSAGQWQQIYPVQTTQVNQIFWLTSEDGSVPPGFQKVDVTSTDVPSNIIAGLMAQYIQDPSATFDQYYAATFIGF